VPLSPDNHAPLAGLLILDLTRAVAGPFCTMNLADLGARVIKIEEPGGGDETRQWGPPFVQGESAYFLAHNRNKESVTLNLKDPGERELLCRLAERADVVIENFRPGVVDRLGIGHAVLQQRNPRLVYASVSGFGQTGPDRLKPGYDLIIQAVSGMMQVSAQRGGPPVKAGFPIADILASLFTGQAILAALYERERTGRGRYIEVALLEAMLAGMASVSSSYLMAGEEPGPMGGGLAMIAPYQVFQCQDGPIAVGVTNERIWQRFCQALGRADWGVDERFRTNRDRTRNRGELVPEIERTLAGRLRAECLALFEQHEIPCGAVQSIGEVMATPQAAARGVAVNVEQPCIGTIRMVGSPMRFQGYTPEYKPVPAAGEHTKQVLREFGLA
jgi:crotonobetainyl-CoA:carnitine CoA-transferase CaiB-like acyl-CoA transferase